MGTQLFRVTSRQGLSVRNAASPNAARVHFVTYGDILTVTTESRTEAGNYVWWEHANNKGLWTASEQINPKEILMTPHQLTNTGTNTGTTSGNASTPETGNANTTSGTATPTNTTTSGATTPTTSGTSSGTTTPATTTTTTPTTSTPTMMEVVADVVNVRSEPKLGTNFVSGQRLVKGQRLNFRNPTQADGYVWWEQADHAGWWCAAGSLQGGQTYLQPVDTIITSTNTGDVVMLEVPWISQIQRVKNLPNDCGHSCALMVMRFNGIGSDWTVNDLYKLPHKNSNGTTNNEHLRLIAKDMTDGKLVFTRYSMPATIENLNGFKDRLRNNQPFILLVWYPSLKFNNPANGSFNHWIVVEGFKGDTFYINDPLWTTENSGADIPIAATTLLKAAADTQGVKALYGVY